MAKKEGDGKYKKERGRGENEKLQYMTVGTLVRTCQAFKANSSVGALSRVCRMFKAKQRRKSKDTAILLHALRRHTFL